MSSRYAAKRPLPYRQPVTLVTEPEHGDGIRGNRAEQTISMPRGGSTSLTQSQSDAKLGVVALAVTQQRAKRVAQCGNFSRSFVPFRLPHLTRLVVENSNGLIGRLERLPADQSGSVSLD